MVAPSNFDVNPLTVDSNVFMKDGTNTRDTLTKKNGRREMRSLVCNYKFYLNNNSTK